MKFESNPQNGTMTIRGIIGTEKGISFNEVSEALGDHGDVTIHLDSPGGVVSEGLNIYNALMAHEGKVTVHVGTIAGSIASVIACAADEVIMNSNAQFMIHRAWTMAMGNVGDMRAVCEQLDALDNILANIYVERAGQDAAHWMAYMEKETFFNAEEAVEHGFADQVYQVTKKRRPRAEIVAVQPCVIQAQANAIYQKMQAQIGLNGDV